MYCTVMFQAAIDLSNFYYRFQHSTNMRFKFLDYFFYEPTFTEHVVMMISSILFPIFIFNFQSIEILNHQDLQ